MTIFTMKKGATGTVCSARLDDADGPLNFAAKGITTVLLSLDNELGSVFTDLPCTLDADQVNNRGVVHCSLANIADNVTPGLYNAEFRLIDSNGLDYIFPTKRKNQYFTIEVQAALPHAGVVGQFEFRFLY